jgi:hypothetical protein
MKTILFQLPFFFVRTKLATLENESIEIYSFLKDLLMNLLYSLISYISLLSGNGERSKQCQFPEEGYTSMMDSYRTILTTTQWSCNL